MKDIKTFILEYKSRVKKSFDYRAIKQAIESCKPKYFGNNVCMNLLWTPQIYFNYEKGWSAGKPDKEFFHGKDYKDITLGASTVLYIDWYAKKHIFKENEFEGRLGCFYPDAINDDEKYNWEEIQKYLESKYNAKDAGNCDYVKFSSYEELEEILKGLEVVINKYNTNYDKNNSAYLYFDKGEATQNASDKKNQYEILTCEEEIAKLNKQLEDVTKAASASDTDLTVLIDSINEKIKFFKDKKDSIK